VAEATAGRHVCGVLDALGPPRLTTGLSDDFPSTMSQPQIITVALLECISLVLIIRLWARKRKISPWQRWAWSIVLLVPIFGWLLYAFLAINPEAHSDSLPERWVVKLPLVREQPSTPRYGER